MNDQYYTHEPSSASRPVACDFSYRGRTLRFVTDAGTFSVGELDEGSRLLLDSLPPLTGRVLDLGCGWGPIGTAVAAANPGAAVTMADVNLRALALAESNAARNGVSCECLESNGFTALQGREFDTVVTNPPIRAGKQVIYKMFADAREQLSETGELYLVIRKQQGAESCEKYLRTLFPEVERLARERGFWVLRCRKAPYEREGGFRRGPQTDP